jgi:myo-inositol-hexaphosphate 3-phosphohydrolase
MKYYLYSLLAVFVIVFIIFGNLLYRERLKSKQYWVLYEQLSNEKIDLSVKNTYRNIEIYLNGKKFHRDVEISDGRGNRVELSQLIDKDKLVLYFSENSCTECVDSELNKLNKRNQFADSGNVIILINASNRRYVHQYQTNHQKIPVYEIKTNQAQLSAIITPFFFILEEKTMRANASFVPLKHQPEETDKYLNKVISDYFE